MPLEYHIPGGVLGALAVGGVHLAEVPFDPEQDVAAHNEAVAVLFIVGGDAMGQTPCLVQDVVDLDAQVECADVLGNLGIPLPLWLAVSGRISFVEHICEVGYELEFVLGGIGASAEETGAEDVQVCLRVEGIAGDAAGGACAGADGPAFRIVLDGQLGIGAECACQAFLESAQAAVEAVSPGISPEVVDKLRIIEAVLVKRGTGRPGLVTGGCVISGRAADCTGDRDDTKAIIGQVAFGIDFCSCLIPFIIFSLT